VGKERTLTLVAFAPPAEERLVTDTLRRLGCNVRMVSGEQWLSSPSISGSPVVFFLARAHTSRSQVDFLCREGPGKHSLMIIADEELARDWPDLAYCSDFVIWPCREPELRLRVDRLCRHTIEAPDTSVWQDPEDELAALNLVGSSPAFTRLVRAIRRLAQFDVPILLHGETGTGKDLAARAIHYLGHRADQPFVPVNCGAVPDFLIENELFGHERGAYTDAKEARPGLVAQAEGGTLFLDEVNTLSAKAQATLLRFLESRQYKPLGAKHYRTADVRILAATNEDLRELAKSGHFRSDLLFRLDTVTLVLPPLRHRRADIEPLAQHYLQRYAHEYGCSAGQLDDATRAWILEYDWPGNIRELQTYLLRKVLLDEDALCPDRPEEPPGEEGPTPDAHSAARETFNEAKLRALEEFERRYLQDVLRWAEGNVTLAARRAGKERRAFGKLLKKHRIDRRRYLPQHAS